MGRSKKSLSHMTNTGGSSGDISQGITSISRSINNMKRQRKERINQPPSTLNVDVHGILFALVAVVFVVYPLAQWALGR